MYYVVRPRCITHAVLTRRRAIATPNSRSRDEQAQCFVEERILVRVVSEIGKAASRSEMAPVPVRVQQRDWMGVLGEKSRHQLLV